MLNSIAEEHKMLVASIYFEEAVETWFQNAYKTIEGINWKDFVEDLCTRFADAAHENVIGDFNKLQ